MSPISDRISKISLGKYDQVVALTQEMMNAGLEGQFYITVARAEDAGKDLHFDVTLPRSGESMIQALLDFPKVIIGSKASSSDAKVVYVIYFQEGTVNLYSNDDVEAADIHLQMQGWYFAFSVDLALTDILDPAREKELRDLINLPGVYTLKQLALDLNTASLQNFNEAFTCPEINILPQAAKAGFTSLISKAINPPISASLTSLGYGVNWDMKSLGLHGKAGFEGIPYPTFQPTFQAFQTYPWIDPSVPNYESHSSLKGNDRLNYLCYKEMTAGNSPPLRQESNLALNGNWTDGTAPIGESVPQKSLGTFAMSRAQFLEGWFLPKLRQFNKVMEPSMGGLKVTCNEHDVVWIRITWNLPLAVGLSGDHPNLSDAHFDWIAKPEPVDPTKAREYVFTSHYSPDGQAATTFGAQFWGIGDCSITNTVSYTPGSDQITLRGTSRLHLNASLKNITTNDDNLTYTSSWGIDFNLQSVSDGGLQIDMVLPSAPSGTWTDDITDIGILSKGDTSSTNIKKYIEDRHAKAFQNFSQIKSDLVTQLTNTNRFTLPAGGTFFYLDPVLNSNGALLCNISYNNHEGSAAKPNPTAPARKVVTVTSPPAAQAGPSSLSYESENKDKAAIRRYKEEQERLAGERATRDA